MILNPEKTAQNYDITTGNFYSPANVGSFEGGSNRIDDTQISGIPADALFGHITPPNLEAGNTYRFTAPLTQDSQLIMLYEGYNIYPEAY